MAEVPGEAFFSEPGLSPDGSKVDEPGLSPDGGKVGKTGLSADRFINLWKKLEQGGIKWKILIIFVPVA